VQVTRYAHRSEEFDVHSDGHTTGDRDDSVTSAVREVELNVSLTALKHRLAVPSIREPDSGWGATEPIGKHKSESGPSNYVAGSVQTEVETLRPNKFAVREPMPEAADVGSHVQADVPQVKRSM